MLFSVHSPENIMIRDRVTMCYSLKVSANPEKIIVRALMTSEYSLSISEYVFIYDI